MAEDDRQAEAPAADAEPGAEEEEHEPPRGTMILMLVYLIITVGIFGSIYLTLLARG